MHIPEFIVGLLAGIVSASALIIGLSLWYGRRGK